MARRTDAAYGLAVSLHTSLKQLQLPEHETILLFQTIRELLINVMKHAQSNEATVSLDQHMGTLRIEVRDNGVGFDPVAVKRIRRIFRNLGSLVLASVCKH